jgi:tetratricopeptide (TPR) repeat protein
MLSMIRGESEVKPASCSILISFATAFLWLTLATTVSAINANQCNSPLECALFAAQHFGSDDNDHQDDMQLIARSYWDLGKREESLMLIQGMKCPGRIYISTTLADEAQKGGLKNWDEKFLHRSESPFLEMERKPQDLNNYAEKFIDLSLSCQKEEDFYQHELLEKLVGLTIKFRQYDKALAIAETIEDETIHKASAFTLLANSFSEMNQNEKALGLLSRALDQTLKSDEESKQKICAVLGEIAACYSRLGNSEKALSILSKALDIAEKDHRYHQDTNKRFVAIGYLNAGFVSIASQIAESLPFSKKVESYISFSQKYLQKGQESNAREALSGLVRQVEMTRQSDSDYDGRWDLYDIAKAYLETGMPEEALNAASKNRNNYYLQSTAIEIAEWALKHGQSKQAIQALDLAAIKYRLIVSEKREEIFPEMSTSKAWEKADGLSAVANKYIEFGKLESAEVCIRAIDLPQRKAMKLADLAVAIARSSSKMKAKGLLDEALQISKTSQKYPHDRLKETALSNIAIGYSEAGEKRKALKLFAQVLKELSASQYSSYLVNRLTMIGFAFERAGLKADNHIKAILHETIKKWAED